MLRKLLVLLLSFGLLLPLFSSTAFAQEGKETGEKKETTTIVVPQNATINRDYFAAGNTIDIEGTINGDVYVVGSTVLMNGVVNGDIIAAGGQLTMKGVARNVRVAGGQVLIEGKVLNNVTALGGTVIIGSGAQLAGSLVGAGGQYTILAPIPKTLDLAAGQVTISSIIGGDSAILAGGQINLTPTAKVNGNLWYQSALPAQVDPGATVTGKLTHMLPPAPKTQEKTEAAKAGTTSLNAMFAGISLVGGLYSLLFGFLIGLALIQLFPVYTHRGITLLSRKPWLSLGAGVVTWLLTPIAVILLAVSIIGLPLIIPVIFLVIVFTFLGKILFTYFFGLWIADRFKWKMHKLVALLIGLVVFEVLCLIPIVGWLFGFLATGAGFGSIILLKKEYYHQLRNKSIL